MRVEDIIVDCLTFPIATGQEETRRDGLETIEAIRRSSAYPDVQTTLGVSNVSFGLNPAARVVLNSVFLHECTKAGLDSAIVHAAQDPADERIPEEQRQVALDMVYDRARPTATTTTRCALPRPVRGRRHRRAQAEPRRGARRRCRWASGCSGASSTASATGWRPTWTRRSTPAAGPRHHQRPPARRHEGRRRAVRHGRDAAAVRAAVSRGHEDRGGLPGAAHGEVRRRGKGTIVLATVKGDVHDIGKNLVDIILSNNGYTVVNLGIKQPVSAILDAADEHDADVDRHVRPAGQEHRRHEGEPRGAQPARVSPSAGRSSSAGPR